MIDTAVPVDRPALAAHPDSRPAADAPTARWLAIHNPAAGGARSGRAWCAFERALTHAGVSFDVATTSGPGAGERIAELAARDEGIDRYLVAGGDGSVHEIVNGLMRLRAAGALPRPPTVVPIPLGTGNDWARSLRLPGDPAALARLVRHGGSRPHDVGRIGFPGRDVPPRWFVNVAGVGFDAHVISRLPAPTPSRFAYLGGALRELARYAAPWLHIDGDAGLGIERRCLLAFVAIGRYCGHRMLVAPDAQPDDGLFDLVAVDDVGLLRALPKLAKLYRGTLLHDPLVQHARSARLQVAADPPTPVEADGQWVGVTPVEFAIEPRALRVLCGG
jgi:YegS/Rv2252/BmrU family lipid kinase